MGRVVVTEFVSLDGVMEAPGGARLRAHRLGRPRSRRGQFAYKLEEVLEAEAHLLGRITYESFAGAWPERTDEAGFADKVNAMPKYVVSSTLDIWSGTTPHLLEGDPLRRDPPCGADRRRDPRRGQPDARAVALRGGAGERAAMMVFPVVLGSGARLLPDSRSEWSSRWSRPGPGTRASSCWSTGPPRCTRPRVSRHPVAARWGG